jgi:hypothetical protein
MNKITMHALMAGIQDTDFMVDEFTGQPYNEHIFKMVR